MASQERLIRTEVKPFGELSLDELYGILRLRADVFVVEQDCPYQDLDGNDRDAWHVFAMQGEETVACLRVFLRPNRTITLGRVVAMPRLRGTGLARKLVLKGLEVAREHFGTLPVIIHSQCYAIGFYRKCGFEVSSGEFAEDGIPHVEMTYSPVPGQEPPRLERELLQRADPVQAEGMARFFKTGRGEYGEGDRFLGVKVPVTRSLVKECWKETTEDDLGRLIASEWHEIRLGALLVLVQKFQHAGKDPETQRRCVDFYLSHTDRIDNWDLVDLSCYEILGRWLLDKDRQLLYRLALDGKNLWEQRIGIVSTMQFVRHGQLDDTFAIADLLLDHPHDLIHKAVGWLLREAGKRDEPMLKAFLDARCTQMPRTMLRYAIERLPEENRLRYLHTKKSE